MSPHRVGIRLDRARSHSAHGIRCKPSITLIRLLPYYRMKKPVFLVLCVILYGFVYYLVITNPTRKTTTRGERKDVLETTSFAPERKKNVLIYAATKFFRMDVTTKRFLGECKSSKDWCRISEDPSDLPNADAVLFHNADYMPGQAATIKRNTTIPFVIWSLESPQHDHFRPEPNTINWTMTYRKDADVWYPYGHIIKREKPIEVDLDAIWAMKKKTATWLASNCLTSNFRLPLIEKLEEAGVETERWGRCGNPPPGCDGVDKQGYDCVATLIKPYKFYMAFENSNCVDYVTEKFYETMRTRMAVPLVIKRRTYENLGIPGNSFIALDDYKNAQEMAAHVIAIANNKTAYLEYHQWRREYEVIPEHHDLTGFCSLCRKLREGGFPSKSYGNLNEWHEKNKCDPSYTRRFLGE